MKSKLNISDCRKPLFYIFISGAGFILDFIIYAAEVGIFEVNPGIANYFSATIAAISVYVVSNILLFNNRQSFYIFYYIIYTELNIIFWSLLILKVTGILFLFNSELKYVHLIAKAFVTPISLLLNYIVTSHLAKISHDKK